MATYIESFRIELEKKMVSVINGEELVKPFERIFNSVREEADKQNKKINASKLPNYTDGEKSIYTDVVNQFIVDNPELMGLKAEKAKESENEIE